MMSLVELARMFARDAHKGQLRKYTKQPYIVHPARVAQEAQRLGLSKEAVAAGYLHDVVEDCGVTLQQIRGAFGPRVCALVDGLSDMQTKADGNRAARKEAVRQRLHGLRDAELHTLKLLDLVDNAGSIMRYDNEFGVTYVEEARQLAAVLDLGLPEAHAMLEAALNVEVPA